MTFDESSSSIVLPSPFPLSSFGALSGRLALIASEKSLQPYKPDQSHSIEDVRPILGLFHLHLNDERHLHDEEKVEQGEMLNRNDYYEICFVIFVDDAKPSSKRAECDENFSRITTTEKKLLPISISSSYVRCFSLPCFVLAICASNFFILNSPSISNSSISRKLFFSPFHLRSFSSSFAIQLKTRDIWVRGVYCQGGYLTVGSEC